MPITWPRRTPGGRRSSGIGSPSGPRSGISACSGRSASPSARCATLPGAAWRSGSRSCLSAGSGTGPRARCTWPTARMRPRSSGNSARWPPVAASRSSCSILRPCFELAPSVRQEGLLLALWSPTEVCVDPREVVADLTRSGSGRLAWRFASTIRSSTSETSVVTARSGRIEVGDGSGSARATRCASCSRTCCAERDGPLQAADVAVAAVRRRLDARADARRRPDAPPLCGVPELPGLASLKDRVARRIPVVGSPMAST